MFKPSFKLAGNQHVCHYVKELLSNNRPTIQHNIKCEMRYAHKCRSRSKFVNTVLEVSLHCIVTIPEYFNSDRRAKSRDATNTVSGFRNILCPSGSFSDTNAG